MAIARSRYAETVVQAAYGCRGRHGRHELTRSIASRGRALIASDGLVETLVTMLATIVFGLCWASIEMRSADAALQARHDALSQAYAADAGNSSTPGNSGNYADRDDPEDAGYIDQSAARPGGEPTWVDVETGYAAVGVVHTPFIPDGAAHTQWTEKPHARSKR